MAILINDTAPRAQYTATSGQTVFTVSFEFFANSDLKVYRNSTLLTLTTNYTVTGAGVTGGGSVTLVSGATAGDIVTIVRDVPVARTSDFPTSGPFNIEALNTDLDRLTAMIQEREQGLTRVIQLSETDTSTSLQLPIAANRASKVLGFDTTGNTIAMQEIGTYRGNWATSTAFVLRDLVKDSSNSNIYICVVAHTSTGSTPISSNADVAKWALLVDAATATSASSSASTSATNAAASASAASSSASSASGSASSASTSASNAASAQAAAESARDATLAAYDNFDDRYLGSKTSDPSVDNDGNALVAGALYFNSTDGIMKLYTGSAWVAAYVSGAGFLALSGGTLTGTVNFVAGSASAPSLAASGDTNTGIFFPAADTIAFAEGGTEVLRLNSDAQAVTGAGTVSLPAVTTTGDLNTGIFYPAADTIAFATAGTEDFRIGSSGQLGIQGANYGTSGQVLTSGGASAAPSWATPSASPSGSLLASPYNLYATTAASGTGTVATITFTPATTIPVGSILSISGMTPSGYNGTYTVTASSSGSVSFASSTTGSQTVAGSFFVTPSGYLYCDGSIYTRSAYPTLAGIIGTPFVASTQTTNYTNASFITTGAFWSEQNTSLQQGIWDANGVLFTNGTVIRGSDQATGLASAMLYSTDGVNWTAATSYSVLATFPNQDAVVFGNSIYVMAAGNLAASAGGNNIQYASTPGGTWTRASVGVISRSGTGCLAFGGTANTFLVGLWNDNCGSRSWVAYYHSTNGSTWTALPTVSQFNNYEPKGIAAYSGGAVIGTDNNTGGNNLWYSATGNSGYTNISSSIGSPSQVYNVSYGNSIFVVRASNGTWTSTTGAGGSWTQVSTVAVSSNYSPLHWSGTAWVDSATGRYTKNFINYGSAGSTLAATAILSGRAYNKVNKTISSYDFNAYTTATQFPVPAITNTVSTSAAFLESGTPSFGYFIKT
jgi:hypothetical protein